MANNTKLKDAKVNDISLWDALETKPIDPNKPNAGAQLVLKEGVKKADGSEFTTKDYFSLSRRYGRLIQRVVGNANEGDRAMANSIYWVSWVCSLEISWFPTGMQDSKNLLMM